MEEEEFIQVYEDLAKEVEYKTTVKISGKKYDALFINSDDGL